VARELHEVEVSAQELRRIGVEAAEDASEPCGHR
jgi:hypothetical protein